MSMKNVGHTIDRFSIGIGALTTLILVVLWFCLTPNLIPELVFPSPHAVWQAIVALRLNLVDHALTTLARVLVGWTLGGVLGIAVGLLMTWNKLFFSIANPLIEVIRPIPPIALIPFFIIWFGLSLTGQVMLVALSCFMVLAVNTHVSVNNISLIYIRAATSLGASKFRIYKTIILPAILPSLVSGFRVAAALAFAVAVAAEFMGAQSGIGYLIMVARRTLDTNVILLGTIILGLESFVFDWGIRSISRHLCRWSEAPGEAIQQL
jgi:ABC-type nitrate/sulfonate/bicarbonate transport system permease component